ncbi:acetyltransferase, partial [Xanthomonas vesicatoria]
MPHLRLRVAPIDLEPPAALGVPGGVLRPERAADLHWLRDLYASTRREELAQVPWAEQTKRAFLD